MESNYHEFNLDDTKQIEKGRFLNFILIEHKQWISKCKKFLNHKAHPNEMIFVAEYGLSKYEDISFQGKITKQEVVIHNTIIEMRNDIISSLKYIALDYDFIKDYILSTDSTMGTTDAFLKTMKQSSLESDDS